MSTQFNDIQVPYDYIRKKSIAIIEHANVQATLAPFINKARVLELACGSGFYTYELLEWGASAVVGVDISPIMIEEARRLGRAALGAASSLPTSSSTNNHNHNNHNNDSDNESVKFIVADCAKPILYPGGPFDLVFAAWLLNHAPNHKGLVNMFRNAVINLKDEGHFVGITVAPTMDPTEWYEAEFKARPPPEGSGGLIYTKTGDVEDGVSVHCYGETEVGSVDIRGWCLRQDVYERAAREAGLKGDLRWGVTSVPKRWLTGEGEGGASLEELRSYEKLPGYGLLVVAK